jgi:hypothetical protein
VETEDLEMDEAITVLSWAPGKQHLGRAWIMADEEIVLFLTSLGILDKQNS